MAHVGEADGTNGEGSGGEPDEGRWSWLSFGRRRIALLFVVGAVLLVLGPMHTGWPEERDIELRIDNAADVRGIDFDCFPTGQQTSDGAHAARWTFGPEGAPRSLHFRASLPEGDFTVVISERRESAGIHQSERVIHVGDWSTLTLPLTGSP